MTPDRLEAWGRELHAVHRELRTQVERIRATIQRGERSAGLSAEFRLFCAGFCTALTSHHTREDKRLFPHVLAAHPALGPAVSRLTDDHRLLAGLIEDLDRVTRAASADSGEVLRHLDGITAIMESHFRYEERELTRVLDSLTARRPDIRSLL